MLGLTHRVEPKTKMITAALLACQGEDLHEAEAKAWQGKPLKLGFLSASGDAGKEYAEITGR